MRVGCGMPRPQKNRRNRGPSRCIFRSRGPPRAAPWPSGTPGGAMYVHIPGHGWRYAETVIDYCSRYLVACHVTPSYSARNVTAALERGPGETKRVDAPLLQDPFLLSDSGAAFLAQSRSPHRRPECLCAHPRSDAISVGADRAVPSAAAERGQAALGPGPGARWRGADAGGGMGARPSGGLAEVEGLGESRQGEATELARQCALSADERHDCRTGGVAPGRSRTESSWMRPGELEAKTNSIRRKPSIERPGEWLRSSAD